MKTLNYFLSAIILLLGNNLIIAQTFRYISPLNNSLFVSLSTNIITKSDDNIDFSSLSPKEFVVLGSKSGTHTGDLKLSDDNKTILFIPNTKFVSDEDVKVIINPGIKTVDGKEFSKLSFHFRTTPLLNSIVKNSELQPDEESVINRKNSVSIYKSHDQSFSTDSLPPDFPQITVGTSNNPSDGNIFLTNQSQSSNNSIGNYLIILNNDGSIVKYKKLSKSANLFKMEPNGQLSYNLKGSGSRIILDTSLTPVDTLQCGNGYNTNGHDFLLLPNGHALLFANDPEPVDMSQIVSGGNSNALVTGVVIQELDASKNVVFQWRSWDYLPITDSYFDLTLQTIDLIHMNGLAVDKDGNILASMRHLSSIVKINRKTGDIIWILGGKQNQFSFINERESNSPNYFSYQHDVSVLPDGDITLFDNGNQHSPEYSRGVEYKLDEQNKTATMVWEYRHTPDIYANAMGSVERLSNGNTIIGWGNTTGNGIPVFTEIHPDNKTALEFFLPAGQFTYRAYKYPWVSQKPEVTVTAYEILQGNTYSFDDYKDTTGITVIFNQLNAPDYSNAVVSKYNYAPVNPEFTLVAPVLSAEYFKIISEGIISYTGEVHVDLNYFPGINNPKETIVFERPDTGNNFVPLATSYDSTKNELIFVTSNFGEFAFGIPQSINVYAPIPISPGKDEIVNGDASVNFIWGTRGTLRSYRFQVASDSTFKDLIADYSNLTSTSFTINSLNNNTTYYWRINSTNQAGTSGWSDIFRFSTSSPFIKISNPKSGDIIYTDSTYIIRWQSNVDDPVKIKLLKNNNINSVLADSIVSKTHAFSWHISKTLQQDSSYTIEVSSLTNKGLIGLSENTFTIESGVSAIKNKNIRIKDFTLSQNYPNPFNPSTQIEYSIPEESLVRIDIFNVVGQKITTLVNSNKNSGSYKITWNAANLSSGIYFYSIRATRTSGRNFFAVKKMVLVK